MNKLGFVVVAALAVGCGDNRAAPSVDASPDVTAQTPAERGQYIMNVLGACTFCHTPLLQNGMRDPTRLFAGVDCFFDLDSPTGVDDGGNTGCLSTRNLTPHQTGLMNATDEQIKNAFRNGIRTDGKKLAPVMPYWVFHNLTDEDADAIVQYLRKGVPAVDHQVRPNQPPWTDFNDGIAPMVPFIDANSEIPFPRGGDNNPSAMHGRYLSSMAGLCIDCHTPEVMPFQYPLNFTKTYGGGRLFPKEALGLIDASYPPLIMTRNLSSDETGLKGWTREQIKDAISKGK